MKPPVFPIMAGTSVYLKALPLGMMLLYEERALEQHGQGIEALARRDGLDPREAMTLIDPEWQPGPGAGAAEIELMRRALAYLEVTPDGP
jgi:hypothetical protein